MQQHQYAITPSDTSNYAITPIDTIDYAITLSYTSNYAIRSDTINYSMTQSVR